MIMVEINFPIFYIFGKSLFIVEDYIKDLVYTYTKKQKNL